MMMKILYIYDKMPGTYQKYLITILESLKTAMGIKVLVYENLTKADYNITTYGLKDNFQRLLFKLKLSKTKSIDLKIMNDFDIIHVQHSFLFQKVISFLQQETRPKIVITLRGADTYLKPWTDKRWFDFYKEYGNKVDCFIAMSIHQKKYLMRWGVDEKRIKVIPISFGVTSSAKPKYPSQKEIKLVSAFRMTWEKNIEGTLRFANLLKERNVPFQFDIYGDGNDLGQLYYLVDRYELHNFINVKGKVENDKLKELLPKYDFFVQLSFSEALPTSVLEAQSMGLPCIVSNADGLPEAVLKGETAIIESYNELDKMVDDCVELWKNKERYYSFSEKAIQHVNEYFSVEKELERLKKLYQSL